MVNCKVELKLKWAKHYVLTVVGTDNADANCDNIIFTKKDAKLFISVVSISKGQLKTIKSF